MVVAREDGKIVERINGEVVGVLDTDTGEFVPATEEHTAIGTTTIVPTNPGGIQSQEEFNELFSTVETSGTSKKGITKIDTYTKGELTKKTTITPSTTKPKTLSMTRGGERKTLTIPYDVDIEFFEGGQKVASGKGEAVGVTTTRKTLTKVPTKQIPSPPSRKTDFQPMDVEAPNWQRALIGGQESAFEFQDTSHSLAFEKSALKSGVKSTAYGLTFVASDIFIASGIPPVVAGGILLKGWTAANILGDVSEGIGDLKQVVVEYPTYTEEQKTDVGLSIMGSVIGGTYGFKVAESLRPEGLAGTTEQILGMRKTKIEQTTPKFEGIYETDKGFFGVGKADVKITSSYPFGIGKKVIMGTTEYTFVVDDINKATPLFEIGRGEWFKKADVSSGVNVGGITGTGRIKAITTFDTSKIKPIFTPETPFKFSGAFTETKGSLDTFQIRKIIPETQIIMNTKGSLTVGTKILVSSDDLTLGISNVLGGQGKSATFQYFVKDTRLSSQDFGFTPLPTKSTGLGNRIIGETSNVLKMYAPSQIITPKISRSLVAPIKEAITAQEFGGFRSLTNVPLISFGGLPYPKQVKLTPELPKKTTLTSTFKLSFPKRVESHVKPTLKYDFSQWLQADRKVRENEMLRVFVRENIGAFKRTRASSFTSGTKQISGERSQLLLLEPPQTKQKIITLTLEKQKQIQKQELKQMFEVKLITKQKQKYSPLQMTKQLTKQKTKQALIQKADLSQIPKPKVTTKQVPLQKIDLSLLTKPKVTTKQEFNFPVITGGFTPNIPVETKKGGGGLPSFKFKKFVSTSKKKTSSPFKLKQAYAPTIKSAIFGRKTRKKPKKKLYTGFEPRPIIIKKKRRKNMIGALIG